VTRAEKTKQKLTMFEMDTLAGIDFGAKMAGTTAITSTQNFKFKIQACKKGEDADVWILEQLEKRSIKTVFIDAPLSLPPAYFNEESNEFFYRKADAALGAMSPMFLGGLTARAMKMKRLLMAQDISVFETYPAALVRQIVPHSKFYKKDIPGFRKELHHATKGLVLPALPRFTTFHQIDSLLAWISGYRHLTHQSNIVGSQHEGLIFI
jgi:uncharacterized protein